MSEHEGKRILDEIVAGLEGVTEAPWSAADWSDDFGDNKTIVNGERVEVLSPGQSSIWPGGIVKIKIADTEEGKNPVVDAAHIARCDPASIRAIASYVEGLEKERDELQQVFDMRWKLDQRAIKMWQEETGKPLTWPDHTDLSGWALLRAEAAEAKLAALQAENDKLRALIREKIHVSTGPAYLTAEDLAIATLGRGGSWIERARTALGKGEQE